MKAVGCTIVQRKPLVVELSSRQEELEKEFTVLQVLLEAGGAVVTPEELLERAWDEQLDPLSNIVRMTVMTLRRKLGDPPVIQTVRGSGYRV